MRKLVTLKFKTNINTSRNNIFISVMRTAMYPFLLVFHISMTAATACAYFILLCAPFNTPIRGVFQHPGVIVYHTVNFQC